MPEQESPPFPKPEKSFWSFLLWTWRKLPRLGFALLAVLAAISSIEGSRQFAVNIPTPGIIGFLRIYAMPVIVLALLTWIYILSFTLQTYRSMLKSERKCVREFNVLSYCNFMFDYRVVNALCKICRKQITDVPKLSHELNIVAQDNIKRVLDHSARIFADFTENDCSCSVRVFSRRNDKEPNLLLSHIITRDIYSQVGRVTVTGDPSNIRDNTANIEILILGKKYFASNDLKADRDAGNYTSHRTGWERDYNSTLVFPIPHPPGYKGATICAGLLCVDSLTGKLNNQTCINYASELSWRLATLIFTISNLDSIAGSVEPEKDAPNA